MPGVNVILVGLFSAKDKEVDAKLGRVGLPRQRRSVDRSSDNTSNGVVSRAAE